MNCFFLLALCRLVVAMLSGGGAAELQEVPNPQAPIPYTLPPPQRAIQADNRIEGTVLLKENGKPLPGVTVTAAGPALLQEQTEFTDASGHYTITDLPDGQYVVTFYFSTSKREFPAVTVRNGETATVSGTIPAGKIFAGHGFQRDYGDALFPAIVAVVIIIVGSSLTTLLARPHMVGQ